jgi:hypothetical protein
MKKIFSNSIRIIVSAIGVGARLITQQKRSAAFYFLFVLGVLILAGCNSEGEKVENIGGAPPNDTAIAAGVDTMENIKGNVSSVVDSPAGAEPPKASLAYAYKNKMKKGDHELIQVHVQLNKPLEAVEGNLRQQLGEQKAREIGSSDTSIVKSVWVTGYKYLLVDIDKYDTAIFKIEPIFGEVRQELLFSRPNKWVWRVTAKKEASKSEIFIIVKSEDTTGKLQQEDISILPIQISVGHPPFFARYGWLLIAVLLVLTGVWLALRWFKKKRIREQNSRIYFSYAWQNATNTIVDKLYNSLKAADFNVIRDKVNLEYKGLISGFMKDIGKGNIIIVSISDKYLKSKFCMFELYEIYRNCGMSKEAFVKKIFPIREEEINLSDAEIIDHYNDYWKAQELELEAIVKDKTQETTSEQFAQYEAVKRIGSEVGNLLCILADINSLNITLLSNNDFAEIKQSLRNSLKHPENGD